MIVLDTNVVAAMMRPKPELKVLNWLNSISRANLFISVLTIVELKFGSALLVDGTNKEKLDAKIQDVLNFQFAGRILVFDEAAADICAKLMAIKKAHTPFVKAIDLQIAATALANGFSVATRDLKDFRHEGLAIINPWAD
jgi:toxin FitB